MTKHLVRIKKQITNYYSMSAQLKAISMKLATVETNQSMVDGLKGVTKVMGQVNENMNIKNIQETLKEFQKQSDKMGMQEEMMNDAVDAGMDTADDEAEGAALYGQICDEIGI